MASDFQPVKKAISKGPTTKLIPVDVPCFKQPLIGRNDEIASLINHLKTLQESPEKGFLLVTGEAGVGKTSLIAHLFSDDSICEKLTTICHFHVAFWLNCAKLKGVKFSESDFTQRLAALAERAVGDHTPPNFANFANFASIVHLFERQKRRRLIFILENVPRDCAKFLEFMRGKCCLIISEEITADQKLLTKFIREPVFQLKPLPDEIVASGFFDVDLKINLGPGGKLAEIVKNCRGLPLIANLVNSRFKIEGNNNSNNNNGDNNFRSICDHVTKIGEKLGIEPMFGYFLEKMSEDELVLLSAFLFYGSDEPISPVDLAILCNLNSSEIAEAQCHQLEAMSLLTRKFDSNNKQEQFLLHPSIRKSAISNLIVIDSKLWAFFQNTQRLSNVTLLLASKLGLVKLSAKDEKIDPDWSLLKLVQKVVTQDRVQLWEKLLRKPQIIRFIYEKFPDTVRMQDPSSRTALMLAVKCGNFETIKFVYERNHAAIKVVDQKMGRLPLSWAIVTNASIEIVDFLFEKYQDAVKTRDTFHGQLPLSLAVEYGRFDLAKFLCEKFEKAVQIEDALGRVPLSVAAQIGRLDLAKFLFERYREAVESTLPLRLAAEYGHLPVVRFLQSQYPQAATVVDEEGLLPSDRASMNGHNDVVEFLLTL